MTLGEKLKTARLEAGLSQRQLCGDMITRNMLSQIENGSARPSMDTLGYFAGKLGKPISWFLEEHTVTSPNRQCMEGARAALAAKNWQEALAFLEDYTAPDETFDQEKKLLETLSCMGLARQALEDGKAVYSRQLLARAEAAGEGCIYWTQAQQRSLVLLLAEVDPDSAEVLVHQLPPLTGELLLRARGALMAKRPAMAAQLLEASAERDATWHLLRGQAALAMGEYAQALPFFHAVEALFPAATAKALETCYRELEDYKQAYFYACKCRGDA